MISDTKKDCLVYAKMLGDYQAISIDELATNYCKAKDDMDELLQNQYLSALILRFWYVIEKLYRASPNIKIDRDECLAWLYEAIEYACKYRAWLDPNKKVNAQQAINMCVTTIRSQHYYTMRYDTNKANYGTVSLDTPVNEGENPISLSDTLIGDTGKEYELSEAELFVQTYVNDNKIVEAILLDTIISRDEVIKRDSKTIKTTDWEGKPYKYTEYSSKFWPYKLVQYVSSLPDDYDKYFSQKYVVAKNSLDSAIKAVRLANNQKLYRYLDKTLEDARLKYQAA